jgi:hypothetical protein
VGILIYLVRLIFRLFFRAITITLELSIHFLIPWIFAILRLSVMLAITSMASLVVGVPTAIRRISESWLSETSTNWMSDGLRSMVRFSVSMVAFLTIILGWAITALGVYLLFKMIF